MELNSDSENIVLFTETNHTSTITVPPTTEIIYLLRLKLNTDLVILYKELQKGTYLANLIAYDSAIAYIKLMNPATETINMEKLKI